MEAFVQSGLAQSVKVAQTQQTIESDAAGGEVAVKIQYPAPPDANHPNLWDSVGDVAKATWFNGITVFGIYGSYEATTIPIAG